MPAVVLGRPPRFSDRLQEHQLLLSDNQTLERIRNNKEKQAQLRNLAKREGIEKFNVDRHGVVDMLTPERVMDDKTREGNTYKKSEFLGDPHQEGMDYINQAKTPYNPLEAAGTTVANQNAFESMPRALALEGQELMRNKPDINSEEWKEWKEKNDKYRDRVFGTVEDKVGQDMPDAYKNDDGTLNKDKLTDDYIAGNVNIDDKGVVSVLGGNNTEGNASPPLPSRGRMSDNIAQALKEKRDYKYNVSANINEGDVEYDPYKREVTNVEQGFFDPIKESERSLYKQSAITSIMNGFKAGTPEEINVDAQKLARKQQINDEYNKAIANDSYSDTVSGGVKYKGGSSNWKVGEQVGTNSSQTFNIRSNSNFSNGSSGSSDADLSKYQGAFDMFGKNLQGKPTGKHVNGEPIFNLQTNVGQEGYNMVKAINNNMESLKKFGWNVNAGKGTKANGKDYYKDVELTNPNTGEKLKLFWADNTWQVDSDISPSTANQLANAGVRVSKYGTSSGVDSNVGSKEDQEIEYEIINGNKVPVRAKRRK